MCNTTLFVCPSVPSFISFLCLALILCVGLVFECFLSFSDRQFSYVLWELLKFCSCFGFLPVFALFFLEVGRSGGYIRVFQLVLNRLLRFAFITIVTVSLPLKFTMLISTRSSPVPSKPPPLHRKSHLPLARQADNWPRLGIPYATPPSPSISTTPSSIPHTHVLHHPQRNRDHDIITCS